MFKTLPCIYLLFVFFLHSNKVHSQEDVGLRGQYLLDNNPVVGASVKVYEGNSIIAQTATNRLGKFFIELAFHKIYVIQFKKRGNPVQKILINTEQTDEKSGRKPRVIVFSLKSSQSSKEGPDPNDVVTSFVLNDKGELQQIVTNIPPIIIEEEEVTEELIEELEEEVQEIIINMPDIERPKEWGGYDELQRKKDSIILLARQKADIIIRFANRQAALKSYQDSVTSLKPVKKEDATVKSLSEINKDISLLIPKASSFRNKDKIKDFETKISRYNKKGQWSTKDSINYLTSIAGLKEEILKTARLQLEIDKLNAKTREDSLLIEQKENKILKIEREIEITKIELSLKNLEIQKKNIAIISMIIISLLMVILIFIVYSNLKRKKKNIDLLSKRNQTIALQKEKIEVQSQNVIQQRDLANQHKQELLDSITYAKKIQMAVLPSEKEIANILPEHFIFFKPRDIVSGDFFWIKQINNFIIIATVDCTGHGVPGAFMSLLGTTFLNEIVNAQNLDNAGEILNKLRDKVKESLHQTGEFGENTDGMDMSFCIIDKKTFELEYAGAYNPLLIVRNGNGKEQKVIELKADKQPIAIHYSENGFSSQKIQLIKNDCIYSFTDGFADQFGGAKGNKLKSKNFKKILASISHEPMLKQKTILKEKFSKWKGGIEQVDDVLIIGIRI